MNINRLKEIEESRRNNLEGVPMQTNSLANQITLIRFVFFENFPFAGEKSRQVKNYISGSGKKRFLIRISVSVFEG